MWVNELLGMIEFLLRADCLRSFDRGDDDHVSLTLLLLSYLVGGAARQLDVGRTGTDLIPTLVNVPPSPRDKRLPLLVLYMLCLDVQW